MIDLRHSDDELRFMYEIFFNMHFYICKSCNFDLDYLYLFVIDSLKIISLKLIAILSFCLYAEDQSRNLHHKFFKFQNKQTRN